MPPPSQFPRVPTAPPTEATTRIQLPWAEAGGLDDQSYDGVPQAVDVDEPTRHRFAEGSRDGDSDGTPTAIGVPIAYGDQRGTKPTDRTRALAVLSIAERLALMKAIEVAARRSRIEVGVSAMPSYAPTAVHLQAADWRAFTAWLKGQARDDFRDVGLELTLPVGKREAARYTLRCLADAAPEMVRLRVGDILYLPFRGDM